MSHCPVPPRCVSLRFAFTVGGVVLGCTGRPDLEIPLSPNVVVSLHEAHYEVEGATAEDLKTSILAHAPALEGIRVYGQTQWRLTWGYRLRRGVRGCEVSRAKVQLAFNVTLPRWAMPHDATEGLARAWAGFLDSLRAHESEHRAITERGASDLAREMELLSAVQCADVSRTVQRAARRMIERIHERNRAYDAETRHGSLRGVRWPPASTPH